MTISYITLLHKMPFLNLFMVPN